jgi:hypothetical protein
MRLVRLAYQPPASSTFLSEQTSTSNQPAVLFSQNKPAPVISHQPNEQADAHPKNRSHKKLVHIQKWDTLHTYTSGCSTSQFSESTRKRIQNGVFAKN